MSSPPHPYCQVHDQPLDWCKHPAGRDTEILVSHELALLLSQHHRDHPGEPLALTPAQVTELAGCNATECSVPAHVHEDDGTVEGCPGCFPAVEAVAPAPLVRPVARARLDAAGYHSLTEANQVNDALLDLLDEIFAHLGDSVMPGWRARAGLKAGQ